MYNKILESQLRAHFGELENVPGNLISFLKIVNNSYNEFETDHQSVKSSFEKKSEEMIKLNNQVKKTGQKELEKMHEQLKMLFENIEEIFYSFNVVSLKISQMSAACEKVYGYTQEEFITDGDLWQKVIVPEDLDSVYKYIKELYEGKQVIAHYRIIHKDKSIRWLESKIIPTMDKDGQLLRMDGVTNDITVRKESENLVKESELRYRSLIEQATDAICIADVSLKFIDMNPYACGLLGYSKEEALKLSVADIVFAGDLKENPFKFNEVQSEQIIRNERRLKKKNGTSVVLEVSTKLMEDGRFIMFGHDISDRKKSEEAMRESEKHLRQIIDLVPHFIFAKDAKGKFVLANEAVAAAYGTTVEDLIGKDDGYFNPVKDEVKYFLQEDLKVMSSGNVKYNIEETMTDFTGITRILSTTKIPYISMGEDTPGVLGVSVDISENKKADNVLKRSEGRLTIAAKIAKLGYWEYDVVKNIFTFSEQFYAIFKTTSELVGGNTMSSERYAELFVHPEDRNVIAMEVENAIKSSDPFFNRQVEHRIIYSDGEIGYVSVHFYLVKDDEGRTVKTFGVSQDITDRKKGEETLLRSEAKLESKNKELEHKNKELEQFAYVASHDLQEPLRTTSSFVSLLQKQYYGQLDPKADKYLTYITQASDRMKVLISDLLEYSQIGNKKELEQVDCNVVIKEVLEDLGKTISDQQAVITTEKFPIISGYRTEIKQLFQNLILNAIKFRKKDSIPEVSISVRIEKGSWIFNIKDNGIGIAEEHKERIFNIFQRLHTREEYAGSGIGLSHCKKIIGLHGGKIWVDSVSGEGSTFHFNIPQNNN